ncbi:MAG: hypothetical protein JW751_20295 [Polyangiaceae bacterium]|nr:hypothetical protein [Polyangiaceae bacterium]
MLDRTVAANRMRLFALGSLFATGCITKAEPLDPSASSAGAAVLGGVGGAAEGTDGGLPVGGGAGVTDPGAAQDAGAGGQAGHSAAPLGGSAGEGTVSGGIGPDAGGTGGRSAGGEGDHGAVTGSVGPGGVGGNGDFTGSAGPGGAGSNGDLTGGAGSGGAGGLRNPTGSAGASGADGLASLTGGAGRGGEDGFGGEGGDGPVGPAAPWKLLVYLCPDRANRQRDWEHLEASLSYARRLEVFALTEDAGEATRLRHVAGTDPSVNGGAGGAGSSEVDVSVLGRGGSDLDLGDPTVLEAFLEYAEQTAPGRRTALVLSGVAARIDGLWSLCRDETGLDLAEVEAALGGGTLELLALDGGQVSNLSVTYQLRHAARYLVSSQSLDFSDFIGAWTAAPEDTARNLARAIVQTHDTGVLGVVSALDTQRMDELRDALDDLAAVLLEQDPTEIEALRPDACPGNYAGVQSVDMHALASLVELTPDSVMTAVEDAVVAHAAVDITGHSESPAYGVAIYLPLERRPELDAYTSQNYDLLASPHRYREFIDWFLEERE